MRAALSVVCDALALVCMIAAALEVTGLLYIVLS